MVQQKLLPLRMHILKREKVWWKKILLWQNGRLSIREDDSTTIIANEIKDFGEQKQKIFTLDITDLKEEQKQKLRGALRYFNGDKNNINVQVKVGNDYRPCGQIYLTEEIMDCFKSIIGEEKVKIDECQYKENNGRYAKRFN